MNLELFSCAGGMAKGFHDAGIDLDVAVDFASDHCDSYEHNLGRRPICMDVRDLLRLVRAGARWEVDLLVADPPCTPWSHAGKRKGTDDERDMLQETCALIAELRPRRYLIGNVPGLDDHTNLSVVQRHIGGLAKYGYCVRDFVKLDAADYGVPQHRIRPFWFGHLAGPCIRWPAPTHGDPETITKTMATAALPGIGVPALSPWVTCRQALGHLTGDELGRPVRMRRRAQNGKQAGSVADKPTRLSDGDVLMFNDRHAPAGLDAPAPTLGAKLRGQGAQVLLLSEPSSKHPAATPDTPSPTIRSGGGGHSGPHVPLALESGRKRKRPPGTQGPQSTRVMSADRPATTVQAREDRVGRGSPALEWPWNRPCTTIQRDERVAPPGHHDEYSIMSRPDAVLLSERAAAILQGFPDDGSWRFCGATKKARWSQLGQAMPRALAKAVAESVRDQDEAVSSGKVAR